MLNENNQPKNNPSIWQKALRFLLKPHPTVTDIEARRQARLVAIITFLMIIITLIGALTVFFVVASYSYGDGLILVALTIVSIFGYGLSRTRLYKLGGYTIVWALVLAAFGGGFSGNLSNSLHSNLIPAIVVASLIFPFRYMAFFVTLNNLLIVTFGVLPFANLEYTSLGADLSVFIPLSVLILVAMRYRDLLEREHLTEVKRVNQELTDLGNELEKHIEESTEKLKERSRQMQAVTEVARTAASFQDLDRLLTSSTRLISENFGFYHVGIFLLDEEGQYAILRATNSEGGQRMLAKRHMLAVDLNSIVGYAAKTQAPRIALDTDSELVYFNNPELPETRSEMAVPLKVGMRLIGVLDVQSTQKDAFSDDDIVILSTLGDQLAVAMDNTRLLTETRRALVTAEQTYQRYFGQAWHQFSRNLNQVGYQYQNGRVIPLEEGSEADQASRDNGSNLSIPLMVRGQDIGLLDIKPTSEKRAWSPDEISILEAAAERAALALESARLLEAAQRRAAREHTISEVVNKIGAITNIDAILRSTVEELGHQIGGTEVAIELSPDLQDTWEQ
jgi:GAF domain-containing protein